MSNIKEIAEERTISINLTISEFVRLKILLEDDIMSCKNDLDESLSLERTEALKNHIAALKNHIAFIKERIAFDEAILNNMSISFK